jgi:hypothetical protein
VLLGETLKYNPIILPKPKISPLIGSIFRQGINANVNQTLGLLKWAYFLTKIKDKIIKKSEKFSHSSFKAF